MLPYIKVNTDKLKTYTTELQEVRRGLNHIDNEFSDARRALEKEIGQEPRLVQLMDRIMAELYVEKHGITKMKNFLDHAIKVYDYNDSVGFQSSDNGSNSPLNKMVKLTNDAKNGTGVYSKLAAVVSRSNVSYDKDGNVIVNGGTRSSGLMSRYKMSAWASNSKLYGKDKQGAGVNSGKIGTNPNDVWAESKSKQSSIGQIVSGAICAAANVISSVGAQLASKAAGAVASVCSAIPIVGPVLSKVAGSATSVVVGKAVSAVVSAVTSSTTVKAVTNVVEKTVGAVQAGAKVVASAAKSVGQTTAKIFKGW